jgi:hypothetical protein
VITALELLIGVALLVMALVCNVRGADAWDRMADAVNLHFPPAEHFRRVGRVFPWRAARLRLEYRRLYPEGPLREETVRLEYTAGALFFLGIVVTMLALTFR